MSDPKRLTKRSRGMVLACNVEDLDELKRLVESTCELEGVVAYLVDRLLEMRYGIPELVRALRDQTDLPLVYEAQREGNAPEARQRAIIELYARMGVNAVVLFPFVSPRVQAVAVRGCQQEGVLPIGGFRLRQELLTSDQRGPLAELEGEHWRGYLSPDAPQRALELYARMGVDHYMCPGPDAEDVRPLVEALLEREVEPFVCIPRLPPCPQRVRAVLELTGDCRGVYPVITVGGWIPRGELVDGLKRVADELLRVD